MRSPERLCGQRGSFVSTFEATGLLCRLQAAKDVDDLNDPQNEPAMYAIYRLFAHYNAWANARLYDAVAGLSDTDYRADLGVFFGSLHRTLNHLVVTDRIWLKRFTGSGDAPDRLDAILYDDLDSLRVARGAEDARIISWVEGLSDADLAALISYRPVSNPVDITQPLAPALSHVFNHQTHHRGQCHAMLTRLTGTAPSLDLAPFQRESGLGMS